MRAIRWGTNCLLPDELLTWLWMHGVMLHGCAREVVRLLSLHCAVLGVLLLWSTGMPMWSTHHGFRILAMPLCSCWGSGFDPVHILENSIQCGFCSTALIG